MGVSIKILKEGNGFKPTTGKVVSVFYKGKLTDGYVFDESLRMPFKFKLGVGEVIDGWDIGVAQMSVGEKAELTISSDLAYGEEGSPPDIPPNSTLIFEVELIAFN